MKKFVPCLKPREKTSSPGYPGSLPGCSGSEGVFQERVQNIVVGHFKPRLA